jgi:hypothetical protein
LNKLIYCDIRCSSFHNADIKLGKIVPHNVKCGKCGKDHIVYEREKSFPKKDTYFCNIKCARSYSTSADDKTETKLVTCRKCGVEMMTNKRNSHYLCETCTISTNKFNTISDADDCTNLLAGKCLYCGGTVRRKKSYFCAGGCYGKYESLIYINKWRLNIVTGNVNNYKVVSSSIRTYLF